MGYNDIYWECDKANTANVIISHSTARDIATYWRDGSKECLCFTSTGTLILPPTQLFHLFFGTHHLDWQDEEIGRAFRSYLDTRWRAEDVGPVDGWTREEANC